MAVRLHGARHDPRPHPPDDHDHHDDHRPPTTTGPPWRRRRRPAPAGRPRRRRRRRADRTDRATPCRRRRPRRPLPLDRRARASSPPRSPAICPTRSTALELPARRGPQRERRDHHLDGRGTDHDAAEPRRAALSMRVPGLYPIGVELRVDGEVVAEHVTFVERLATDPPVTPPLNLAVVAAIDDPGPAPSPRRARRRPPRSGRDRRPRVAGGGTGDAWSSHRCSSRTCPPTPSLGATLADALDGAELVSQPADELDPSSAVAIGEAATFTRELREGEDILAAALPVGAGAPVGVAGDVAAQRRRGGRAAQPRVPPARPRQRDLREPRRQHRRLPGPVARRRGRHRRRVRDARARRHPVRPAPRLRVPATRRA